MAMTQREEYSCDKCGKKLRTHGNQVAIQTDLTKEWDNPWSRLRVVIEHHHGYHNDGEVNPADLCQKCAIEILTDALKQVKSGVRMTKGVQSVNVLKFNEVA
jgi:hypothetical protein